MGCKLELGEVGTNGGEPNAGGRKADVLEDSLGELELNDDRRLSTSITSASVDLFSEFSLRIFTDRSNDCSDDFISCSCSDCCTCSDFISCSCRDCCTLGSSC